MKDYRKLDPKFTIPLHCSPIRNTTIGLLVPFPQNIWKTLFYSKWLTIEVKQHKGSEGVTLPPTDIVHSNRLQRRSIIMDEYHSGPALRYCSERMHHIAEKQFLSQKSSFYTTTGLLWQQHEGDGAGPSVCWGTQETHCQVLHRTLQEMLSCG